MTAWIEAAGGRNKAAALVAPAIRACYSKGRIVHVRFQPDPDGTESGHTATLAIGGQDDLEAVYDSIGKDLDGSAELPVVLDIAGLGRFVVTDPGKQQTRLAGRICLITGGAQGFGEGIARALAAQGGTLVIGDLNDKLAGTVVSSICNQYGEGAGLALKANVGDEASVEQLVEKTVLAYGGLDLMVSNAGILRAGGLEDMTLDNFELVTKINYTAFFLMTKHSSRPMKIQSRFDQNFYADVVQINSKSGLEGSNRNFAYAGGKFGGIGLVQSFAKELVDNRIKVNAICPGNYYEGPLWSDPEKGLFVQYLNAGKVPGAKNVQDIYDFYVDKVPMRRGCSPKDVTRAIMYCIEQQYETGQAIPVTGGQNMLK